MGWADWMTIQTSLEEELMLENQARAILNSEDHAEIAKLCAALIKTQHHQSMLLRQAVGRVIELECTIEATAI